MYVTSDLIIRGGFPTLEGQTLSVVTPGTALKYIGFITDGYNVGGKNSLWYVSESGDFFFFWSGNTTTITPAKESAFLKKRFYILLSSNWFVYITIW